ncbi:60s ribosomal protein l10a, partial [Lynx pardinus]
MLDIHGWMLDVQVLALGAARRQDKHKYMVAKVDEVKSTVKFQMNLVLCLATATVDYVKVTDDEPVYNIHLAVDFL